MARPDPMLLDAVLAQVRLAMAQHGGMVTIGICGAQGSGKTTLCAALAEQLRREGVATAVLSLDDLYLPRAARLAMARDRHPLFATRGVPGTHDPALGHDLIAALASGQAAALPRFDKGRDDRAAPADWPLAPAHCRVLLFEGWCLGAVPQPQADLANPVNPLEADEDPQALWRGAVNQALAGPYQDLFARIDRLVLLAAPGWSAVAGWREQQEAALRAACAPQAMDSAAVLRFIQHYERLTRWILAEMPGRAELTLPLGPDRALRSGGQVTR